MRLLFMSVKKLLSKTKSNIPIIPSVLVLISLFMTIGFMNCKLDSPEPLNNSSLDNQSANPNNQQSSVLEPTNYSSIVNDLASQLPNDLNEACNSFYFLDQVVEVLRAENVNFGYSCEQGDCENISKDSVAFYQGSPNTQQDLSNVAVIKIIDNVCEDEDNVNPSANWIIQSEDTVSRWHFPRINGGQDTGSINISSDCNPTDAKTLIKELANTYSQDFLNSCQDEQNWGFVDRVLDRLSSLNNRWGYFCPDGDCNNLSTDTIIYSCGFDGSVLSASIISILNCDDQENPQVIWNDDTQNLIDTEPNATIGWRFPRVVHQDISQIASGLQEPDANTRDLASANANVGTFANGQCSTSREECVSGTYEDVLDTNFTVRFQCTGSGGGSTTLCFLCPPGKTEPDYKVRSQNCLPSCDTAGGTHSGSDCQDDNYSIQFISSHESGLCCTRTLRNSVNGACDIPQKNCSAGDYNDLTDSDDLYIWECQRKRYRWQYTKLYCAQGQDKMEGVTTVQSDPALLCWPTSGKAPIA